MGGTVLPADMIEDAVSEFIHDLEGIKSAELIACPLIQGLAIQCKEEYDKFAESLKVESSDDSSGNDSYLVPFESAKQFRHLRRQHRLTRSAILQTPRALLVAMVSAFDAYLGRLLRCLFLLKPELLNTSQRSLTFSEIVGHDSLEAARDSIIEAEISDFLRDSHVEHFEWLEKRLNMPLRKDLESWPTFVEITQRRNLLVHCDGAVSKQYLEVCGREKVSIEGIEVGEFLPLDSQYFENAFECLYEIGVKLAHVSWRKLAPKDLEQADDAFNSVGVELLQGEKYRLAFEMFTFASKTLKRHSNAFYRRVFVINRAIASKFGKIGSYEEILEEEDWSDCDVPFQLAVTVLNNKFDEAVTLMKQIGAQHTFLNRLAYDTWPLFREFRDTSQFRDAYRELFGDELKLPNKDDNDLPETG